MLEFKIVKPSGSVVSKLKKRSIVPLSLLSTTYMKKHMSQKHWELAKP